MKSFQVKYTTTVKVTFSAKYYDTEIARVLENLRESNAPNVCITELCGKYIIVTFMREVNIDG